MYRILLALMISLFVGGAAFADPHTVGEADTIKIEVQNARAATMKAKTAALNDGAALYLILTSETAQLTTQQARFWNTSDGHGYNKHDYTGCESEDSLYEKCSTYLSWAGTHFTNAATFYSWASQDYSHGNDKVDDCDVEFAAGGIHYSASQYSAAYHHYVDALDDLQDVDTGADQFYVDSATDSEEGYEEVTGTDGMADDIDMAAFKMDAPQCMLSFPRLAAELHKTECALDKVSITLAQGEDAQELIDDEDSYDEHAGYSWTMEFTAAFHEGHDSDPEWECWYPDLEDSLIGMWGSLASAYTNFGYMENVNALAQACLEGGNLDKADADAIMAAANNWEDYVDAHAVYQDCAGKYLYAEEYQEDFQQYRESFWEYLDDWDVKVGANNDYTDAEAIINGCGP